MGTYNKGVAADSGNSKDFNNKYEKCACCHKRLNILKSEEIEFRPFYIEGAGQLCYECYHELYTENFIVTVKK